MSVLPSLHSHSGLEDNDFHSRHPSPLDGNGHAPTVSGSSQTTRSYPWGLRSTLLFPLPFYPLAIFINLILRLTWSMKLSSHLHSHADGAFVIFWIEVAELLRRWMWVFFRIEWECVKSGREPRFRTEPQAVEMERIVFDEEQKAASPAIEQRQI